MEIIYKKIKEIKPYKNNPRKNDEAVEYVANSIKEFGFKVPIIIDKNNEIVAGHTRYKASKKLGIKEVPCIVADDLNEEQIKAFRIADNKVGEIAEWDEQLLNKELKIITNIDMALFNVDLNELSFLTDDFEVEEDDFSSIKMPKTPQSKLGDIYKLGNHILMCGDSTKEEDVEKLVKTNSKDDYLVDILYTDPPYNVDVENSDGLKIENDNLSDDSFRQLLEQSFKCASENLKDGGAFYVWYADGEAINFRNSLAKNDLLAKQTLIWVKNSFNFGRQDYKWQHEPCIYGWKSGASHYFKPEYNHSTVIEEELDFDKMKKEQLKEVVKSIFENNIISTVFHENKPTKNDLHPTMKPIKMCAYMIRNSSKPKDKVLDLFGGSGSTLIACEQLGRICYMMEYDPKYVDVIIQRWENFTGQKAIQVNKK